MGSKYHVDIFVLNKKQNIYKFLKIMAENVFEYVQIFLDYLKLVPYY